MPELLLIEHLCEEEIQEVVSELRRWCSKCRWDNGNRCTSPTRCKTGLFLQKGEARRVG
jgi:hypothetical protein